MVITDAGTHDVGAGLAHVAAAYMPDAGQTVMDLFTAAGSMRVTCALVGGHHLDLVAGLTQVPIEQV